MDKDSLFLGVVDFMLINGGVALNMSMDIDSITRNKETNTNWRVYDAEEMLN